jgi:hypothetical protein
MLQSCYPPLRFERIGYLRMKSLPPAVPRSGGCADNLESGWARQQPRQAAARFACRRAGGPAACCSTRHLRSGAALRTRDPETSRSPGLQCRTGSVHTPVRCDLPESALSVAVAAVAIVCGSSHLLPSGRGADCPRARTRRARRLRATCQLACHGDDSCHVQTGKTHAKNVLAINDAHVA